MPDISNMQMRDAFITGIFAKAREDKSLIFVSNEYGAPALDRFREELPGQFINAGISEQNIISVAAGLALSGKNVFVYSIASFITLRCFEQIKLDVCVHNAPVTILGVGTCYAYSEDGPTHHASEDIALMRTLANLEMFSPADAQLAFDLVDYSCEHKQPRYIRFDKGVFQVLERTAGDFTAGYKLYHSGCGAHAETVIVATGVMVHRALEVARKFAERSIAVAVLDVFRLKKTPEDLVRTLSGFKNVITLEEHTINGGLGSIVAELVVDCGLGVRVRRLAVTDDKLYTYGVRKTLHKDMGLDVDGVVSVIDKLD